MFQIDLSSRTPIYEQLHDNMVQLIMKGVLKEGEQLPSVRTLAKQLSVNPNTVQKAYQELERNEFIYTVIGRGNFVAAIKRDQLGRKAMDQVKQAVLDAMKAGLSKDEIIQMIEELNEM